MGARGVVRGGAALGLSAVIAAAVVAPPSGAVPPDGSYGATLDPVTAQTQEQSYPVYDARGRRTGTQRWRLTSAGGNCCEVYVAATSTGRLLEFGGSYPLFSDDKGRHWTQVSPLTPVVTGEGAIAVAPDGDVVAVGWDPYGGDRLEAFKYDAQTRAWRFAESPLHTPFYDREWIGVAKGPFTILGQQYPYATVVMGGGVVKDQMLISGDGLNYVLPSCQLADSVTASPTSRPVPVRRDAALDWEQGHSEAGYTPLAGSGLLMSSNATTGGCARYSLSTSATWSCSDVPGTTHGGILRQDSRGWLHEVLVSADHVTLRTSTDGGRHWKERQARSPLSGVLGLADVKVSGALRRAVVSAHLSRPGGKGQQLVFEFDTGRSRPAHTATMLVGRGDLDTGVGIAASGDRLDFTSVALLPDGALAVSVDDSTTQEPGESGHSPWVAVQL